MLDRFPQWFCQFTSRSGVSLPSRIPADLPSAWRSPAGRRATPLALAAVPCPRALGRWRALPAGRRPFPGLTSTSRMQVHRGPRGVLAGPFHGQAPCSRRPGARGRRCGPGLAAWPEPRSVGRPRHAPRAPRAPRPAPGSVWRPPRRVNPGLSAARRLLLFLSIYHRLHHCWPSCFHVTFTIRELTLHLQRPGCPFGAHQLTRREGPSGRSFRSVCFVSPGS